MVSHLHSGGRATRLRCATIGCPNVGTGEHHLQYRGPRWWYEPPTPFGVIFLCRPCHVMVEEIEKRLGHNDAHVPVAMVTLQYILNPELTIAWVRRVAIDRPPGISDEQLGLADSIGPAGDYFRNWMLEVGYAAPPHRPWTREEIAARDGDTLDDAA